MITLRVGTGRASAAPESAATGERDIGYGRTVLAALASPRRAAVALVGTAAYLFFLSYVAGMLIRPLDQTAIAGRFEAVFPVGEFPYATMQLGAGWLLQIDVVQAAHFALIAPLVTLLIALLAFTWVGTQRRLMAGPAAALSGVSPALLSGGACALACTAAPAGFLFIPASFTSTILVLFAIAHIQTLVVLPILVITLYIAFERARRVLVSPPEVRAGSGT